MPLLGMNKASIWTTTTPWAGHMHSHGLQYRSLCVHRAGQGRGRSRLVATSMHCRDTRQPPLPPWQGQLHAKQVQGCRLCWLVA